MRSILKRKPGGFWSLPTLANLSDDDFDTLVAEISAQIVESLNDPAGKAPHAPAESAFGIVESAVIGPSNRTQVQRE